MADTESKKRTVRVVRKKRRTRTYDSGAIVMFTIRVEHGRLLLNPSGEGGDKIRELVLMCLCRAAERYDLEVFAFVVLGNHIHIALRSNKLKHSKFLRDFNSTLAVKLRQLRGHPTRVFHQKAKDVYIDGPDAFVREMAYILANPCHHDLVDHPGDWRGASSWEATCGTDEHGDHVLRGVWTDRDKARSLDEDEMHLAQTTHYVPLARPGFWPEKSDTWYFEMIEEAAIDYADEQRERREKCREHAQGMDRVATTSPMACVAMPDGPAHSGIHTGDLSREAEEARIREFLDVRDDHLEKFDRAIERLEDDVPFGEAGFPHGTHPPGLQDCYYADGPGAWEEFRRSAPGLENLSQEGRDNYIRGRGIRIEVPAGVGAG